MYTAFLKSFGENFEKMFQEFILIVFDVQLSIWRTWSCSTDGVKNAISPFIKFRLVDQGHNSDILGKGILG